MYKKYLYAVPPSQGKTRFLLPEIIKNTDNGKTIYWFSDKDNTEYCGLKDMDIQTLSYDNCKEYTFHAGKIYQIVCGNNNSCDDIFSVFENIYNDTNAVVIFDSAIQLIGNGIISILAYTHEADIHLLCDSLEQVYMSISSQYENTPDYKEKKFMDRCRKEFNTYEKNRIFWIENRGVTKAKRKSGDAQLAPIVVPLPTYQPYTIFGCTLYHFKIGSFPGMTTEEIVDAICNQK